MPGKGARAHWRREREPSCQTLACLKVGKMELGVVAVVSAVAWVVHWNTLAADFAYDDSRAIKTNQDLLPSTPLSNLFRDDFWGTPLIHSGSHKSYRPLCVFSFRINFWLGGFDPWGYHLVNVLLHALVSGLFTHLAAGVFLQHSLPTMVAGLLFAVHPIHTEAVAGVVGRADVGACLFFLLALQAYVQYCKWRDKEPEYCGRRWMALYGALGLATGAMLTKEHGITVLGVCAVYDVLIQHRLTPRDIPSLLVEKRYQGLREGLLHLVGAAIVLVGFRVHLMGRKPPDFAPADNPAADSDSFVTRTLTFLYLPAFNFWLLLCPLWLSFDWSMEAVPLVCSIFDPRNLVTLCFYGGLIYTFLFVHRHLPRRGAPSESAFSLVGSTNTCTCQTLNQSPKLSFYSNHSGPAQRHKKFTPILNNNNNNHAFIQSTCNGHRVSNGTCNAPPPVCQPTICYSASDCCECAVTCSYRLDAVILSLAFLVLPFIPATNLFFYVGFVIAERVLYIPSVGFCLLVGLGLEQLYKYQESSRRRKALICTMVILLVLFSVRTFRRNLDWRTEESLYRSGIHINPPKAYGNLANILSAQGKKTKAEWAYRKALTYRSNMADVHYNLGILLQEQGRFEEALQSYKVAIQFRPRLAMAHLNMGLVLGILGRKEEAIEVYRHCAQLDSAGLKDPKKHESTKISALFNLGRLYADEGKYHEAIDVYQEAMHKMPDHYQPQSLYNMLGEAFFKLGKFVDAEQWYKEALRVKPDHVPAHLTYAKLLSKWHRPVEAEQWFLKAMSIAPNDSSVYQHYGQFLSESERHNEAAETYLRAAQLAPEEYEIVFNAANTLRQAGRNAEAEDYYHLAVKLRPNDVTSHMNLGAMLHVNGKLLEAESSYLEALRLKPDDPITHNNLQKLRNLLAQKRIQPTPQHRR
ncbi:transmembrane and TPR repeat-containing protein 2-like isoform X1 [Limulus polyphemus]|uniref:dolichyl-phosphate-mannose--protein mannosyltransferase n=1 Tax=Limulus polyphemus TaxID=6850 RepID=A0ABM1B7B0_LIMPO|nr:transmembrane and TPR repeat-containing protein 2-like isoform X1 [Limulus polyphemus]